MKKLFVLQFTILFGLLSAQEHSPMFEDSRLVLSVQSDFHFGAANRDAFLLGGLGAEYLFAPGVGFKVQYFNDMWHSPIGQLNPVTNQFHSIKIDVTGWRFALCYAWRGFLDINGTKINWPVLWKMELGVLSINQFKSSSDNILLVKSSNRKAAFDLNFSAQFWQNQYLTLGPIVGFRPHIDGNSKFLNSSIFYTGLSLNFYLPTLGL